MIESFSGEYRWLSNFWLEPVSLNGLVYPSVENAYQASKAPDGLRQPFVNVTPAIAKELGQYIVLSETWDIDKLAVMEHLLKMKFRKHSFLAERLIQTGNQELIEGNNWGDVFWGVSNNIGENHLGELLMKVRDEVTRI